MATPNPLDMANGTHELLPTRKAWGHALATTGLVLALMLVLYYDTAVAMVTIWYRSETFTHGFVVVPIVGWLVWRRRRELALLTPRPTPTYLVLIAALAFMWLMGDLVAVNSVTQLAMVAMLVASVPVLLGSSVALAILFPLSFMFFAVPIGEVVMPQLMDWTADFTIVALRWSGIPVYREGLNFVIPTGHWSVVEACSGVRYLIASVTVGTLYAYLNYQSMRRRVLFVLVSILVPIVANWVRAYMIVMLGHLSGNTIAVGVDHLIYGWVFFGVVILLMFVIGSRWSEPEIAATPLASPIAVNGVPFSAVRNWLVAVVLALTVSVPVFVTRIHDMQLQSTVSHLEPIRALSAEWERIESGEPDFKPHFENPSAESLDYFVRNGQFVGVYRAYYRGQDYGSKLVSSNNVLVKSDDRRWSLVSREVVPINFADQAINVRKAEIRRLSALGADRSDRILAWQWYWINGTVTSSDYLAKAFGALHKLLGRGDDSAVVVVFTVKNSSNNAQQTLADFMAANYPAIDGALRKTRNNR